MMKQWKKLLAALLVIIMVISMAPMNALAADGMQDAGASEETEASGSFVSAPYSAAGSGIVLLSAETEEAEEEPFYTTTYQFYVNGEMVSEQIIANGETLYAPETPTTEGSKFVGWFVGEEEFDGFGIVTVGESSQTIRIDAKIEAVRYVFFMAGAGSNTVCYTMETTDGETIDNLSEANASVPVKANESVVGWKLNGTTVTSVKIDGSNVTLVPEISSGYWLSFETSGGSVVPSVFYTRGQKTMKPADPTFPGYTFAGWYSDEARQKAYSFGSGITSDTTVHANWEANTDVTYYVDYWLENANDDNYSFYMRKTYTGTTGALAEVKPIAEEGFTYSYSDVKAIDGNGSTIVNAYYKRNVYTVYFNYGNGKTESEKELTCLLDNHTHNETVCGQTMICTDWKHEYLSWVWWFGFPYRHNSDCYTFSCGRTAHEHSDKGCYVTVKYDHKIDAKYGADISKDWPGGSWYVTPAGEKSRKSQAYLEQMPLNGFIFYEETSGNHWNEAYYYVEALGNEDKPMITVGEKQYYLLHTDRSRGTGNETVTDEERYTIKGFICNEAISTKNTEKYDHSAFYYDRQVIDITFSNGDKTFVRSFKYGESIYNAGPALTEADRPDSVNDGFVFDSWYADKDFVSKYDFAPKSGVLTMPAEPIIVYAKWVAPTYNVEVKISDAETVLMKVEYGKSLVEAVGAEDPSLTWEALNAKILENHTGEMIVWYIEAGNRINTEDKLADDMVVAPRFIKSGTTYSVTYYYDTQDGTAELKNSETYAFGAKAVVKAADGLGAEGKVFLYWIDQDGEKHYPMTSIAIDQNVVLTAVWGDKPQKTMLIYHANFEGAVPEVYAKDNINVNSSVRILSYEDTGLTGRENYLFLGWSLNQDAVTAQYQEEDNINVKYNSIGGTHLYAVWQKETYDYTINYYLNGTTYAVAEATNGSAEANTAITISDTQLALEGYTLVAADQGKDLVVNGRNKSFAIYYYKNIELTAKSKTVSYNGAAQKVEGYDVSGALAAYPVVFAEAITVGAQGTDVGEYAANFNEDKVSNGLKDKDGHYIVVNVTNGLLKIDTNDEAELVVTITGTRSELTYNGSVQTAEGYTYTVAGADNDQVNVTLAAGKEAKATGENVGTYWMDLDESDFVVTSDNYSNITVNVNDGWLKIGKSTAAVVVTITGNSDTVTYNGNEQSVAGYTYTVSGAANKEMILVELADDQEANAYGLIAGNYPMGLSKDSFVVTSDYYSSIEVIVVDGGLKIDAIATPIQITAGSASRKYNGQPLTNEEYTYTQNILLEGDELIATVSGSQLNAGSSSNIVTGFTVMRGETDVTSSYTFAQTVNGTLSVSQRVITLVSATDNKTYDGTALTNGVVTLKEGSDEFVDGEEPEITVIGQQLTSGNSSNTFAYSFADAGMEQNYSISEEYGTLTVSEVDEVVVTIRGNSTQKTYNGAEQSMSGYEIVSISNNAYSSNDFTFNGNAEVKGTLTGTYSMGLKETDFVNTNTNFIDVTFVIQDGSLVIDPIESVIDITAASDSKKYDGTPLTNAEYTYTEGVLLEGDKLSVTVNGSLTDAGSVANTITAYKVMRGTVDVTACYTFGTITNGMLAISPREVTLTSATVQKTYNGSPLTNDIITIGGDKFVKGEGVDITMTGTQTDVGSSSNTFTYACSEGTNLKNYTIQTSFGTLTVLKINTPITITAASAEKDYDGSALENKTATYTENILVDGDELIVVVEGSQTNAGSTANVVASFKVMQGDKDVTSFYTFAESVPGTLLVNKQMITLTSAGDTRSYDGTELTKKVVTVTKGAFAEGEGFEFTMTGSQLYVGTSKNTFNWQFAEGTNGSNYIVSVVEGNLQVTEYAGKITVSTIGDSFSYNGTAQGTTVQVTGIPTGYSLGTVESATRVTHVADGEVVAEVTSLVIYNEKKEDVTKDLTIEYNLGKIKITPISIELESGSGEALYNNAALTNSDVTVKKGAFVSGEGYTAETNGSQTLVGSSENTFIYTLNEGTDSRDYTITTKNGTLTVLDTLDGVHPADGLIVNMTADAETYDLNDTIVFTITVKNICAEAQKIVLTEQDDVTIVGEKEKMADAGETVIFTAEHIVTEADIVKGGFFSNTASAQIKENTYATTASVGLAPMDTTLEVTLTSDAKETVEFEDEITYTIIVKNVGNVTITDAELVEGFENKTYDVGSLVPGAEQTYQVVYKTTMDDIMAGVVKETVEVKGTDPEGQDTDNYTAEVESATESIYTLTIHYESVDGEILHEAVTRTFLKGDEIMIYSPEIEGYEVLDGQGFVYSAALPAQDVELTVQYKAIPVIPEKPEEEESENEESETEESQTEESKTEESKIEESKTEESKTEGSKIEESKSEDSEEMKNNENSAEEISQIETSQIENSDNTEDTVEAEVADTDAENSQQITENTKTENGNVNNTANNTANVTADTAAEEILQVQGIEIVQDVESGYNLQTISEEEALENKVEKSDICILHYVLLLAALATLIVELVDEKKRKTRIHGLEEKLTAAGIDPKSILKK